MVTTKDTVYIALFAAIMAALGAVPPLALGFLSAPITAQSLGVMLAGGVLGATRGALSLLLFLLLVAIGLPLLAGGRGGLSVFAGPTVGFLIGFPVAAYVTGLMVQRFWSDLSVLTAALSAFVGGVLVLYLFGITGLAVQLDKSWFAAAQIAVAFLPGDALKVALAAVTIMAVKKYYPAMMDRQG